jgi:hypothetical protein
MTYDPAQSHRYIGQPDHEPDPDLLAKLSEKLSAASETIETCNSSGWKHIVATLEHEIYRAERRILEQQVVEPRDVALVRGQILGFRTLLEIPRSAQQDFDEFHARLKQETEPPA